MFYVFETREQRTYSVFCLHVSVSERLFDFRHLFAAWGLRVQSRLSAHPISRMLLHVPLIFEQRQLEVKNILVSTSLS